LRVVVVDDEEPARLALRQALASIDGVEIVAECANGFDAVKVVSESRPDVLLLDVQMPKLDGFDVLELVGRDVPVIFVTAYDEFALRAFEVHAVDYLLKPFAPERLAEVVDRRGAAPAGGIAVCLGLPRPRAVEACDPGVADRAEPRLALRGALEGRPESLRLPCPASGRPGHARDCSTGRPPDRTAQLWFDRPARGSMAEAQSGSVSVR